MFDDEEKRGFSRQISEKKGFRAKVLTVPAMSYPLSTFRMTPTDWQIARPLLRNAEKKLTEVAAVVKASARTVKRRLNEMMTASAISIQPMVNLKKTAGISY